MRALCFLEWRYIVHNARQIVRSPIRLGIWIVYALTIVGLFATRTMAVGHHRPVGNVVPQQYGTASLAGIYLGFLAVTIALAASGRVAAFRTLSEAVLFSTGGIRPLTIALWLQARKLAAGWMRPFGSVVYFLLIFTPNASGEAYARAFLFAALAFAIQIGAELPTFLLARRGFGAAAYVVAALLGCAALVFGVAGFATPSCATSVSTPVRPSDRFSLRARSRRRSCSASSPR